MTIAVPPVPPTPARVERGAILRRVVLGSPAPRRLAAWYQRALGLPASGEAFDAGDVELAIVPCSDLADAAIEPNRAVLNFVVDDVLKVEARLVAMGAIWVRELERTSWGMIGSVLDLDGNLVQVIQIIEPARGASPGPGNGREELP